MCSLVLELKELLPNDEAAVSQRMYHLIKEAVVEVRFFCSVRF